MIGEGVGGGLIGPLAGARGAGGGDGHQCREVAPGIGQGNRTLPAETRLPQQRQIHACVQDRTCGMQDRTCDTQDRTCDKQEKHVACR